MEIKKCDLTFKKKKINEDITHQNIGGKEILIEGEVGIDVILLKSCTGNWACKNFIDRRSLKDLPNGLKYYYGKVGNLGYIVASDEIR